jgi:hypothetical protein
VSESPKSFDTFEAPPYSLYKDPYADYQFTPGPVGTGYVDAEFDFPEDDKKNGSSASTVSASILLLIIALFGAML